MKCRRRLSLKNKKISFRKKVPYVEYNEEKHKEKPKLELGMTFGNFTEFKQACMEWGIKNRRQLKFYPNDTEREWCVFASEKTVHLEFMLISEVKMILL